MYRDIAHFGQRPNLDFDTLITQEEDIRKEEETVKEALKMCGYPDWSIKRKKDRNNEPKKKKKIRPESFSLI